MLAFNAKEILLLISISFICKLINESGSRIDPIKFISCVLYYFKSRKNEEMNMNRN